MTWRNPDLNADTTGARFFQRAWVNQLTGRIADPVDDGYGYQGSEGYDEVEKWVNLTNSTVLYKLIQFLSRFWIGTESSTSAKQKITTGTWDTVSTSGLTSTNISSIVRLTNGRYIAGINSSCWYSDDNGLTWTNLIANTFGDVEIVTDGTLTAVVTVGGLTAAWKIEGNTATSIASSITVGATNSWNSINNVLYDGTDFVFLGQTVNDGSYDYACVAWSSDLSSFSFGESAVFEFTSSNAFLAGYYDNGTYYLYCYEDAAGTNWLPYRTTTTLKTAVPIMTYVDILNTLPSIAGGTPVRAFLGSSGNVIVQIAVSYGTWEDIFVNGSRPQPMDFGDLEFSFSYAEIDGLSVITGYNSGDNWYKVFSAIDPTGSWTEITNDSIGTGVTNTVVVASINA